MDKLIYVYALSIYSSNNDIINLKKIKFGNYNIYIIFVLISER